MRRPTPSPALNGCDGEAGARTRPPLTRPSPTAQDHSNDASYLAEVNKVETPYAYAGFVVALGFFVPGVEPR